MSKTIAILTATRAEYGLLRPIITALRADWEFTVRVLVTGAHLSGDFGETYKEIEADGIPIDAKIDILTSGADTPQGVSCSMALAIQRFADYFEDSAPDALMVLGDRYETFAVCCAAMNARIPILHLHGGETTQGAVDEAIRHAITKMSYLHFASNAVHRKRIIQLGESPSRVFDVGAVGVENAMKLPLLTKTELEQSIGFALDVPYAVVTFHPVTLETGSVSEQFQELEQALGRFPHMKFIITKANADAGGKTINALIDRFEQAHDNVIAFQSLGVLRYLSAVKYSAMVIGNSSSGIIEVPSFRVPTINIGDRQKGRMQAASILNCDCHADAIIVAMNRAMDRTFLESIRDIVNPYGDGNTVGRILDILRRELLQGNVNLKKEFYDVEFNMD